MTPMTRRTVIMVHEFLAINCVCNLIFLSYHSYVTTGSCLSCSSERCLLICSVFKTDSSSCLPSVLGDLRLDSRYGTDSQRWNLSCTHFPCKYEELVGSQSRSLCICRLVPFSFNNTFTRKIRNAKNLVIRWFIETSK